MDEEIFEDELEQSQPEENTQDNNYKIWKKNAPYLYDILITWDLKVTSLCVNWVPKVGYTNESLYLQKLILGTFSNGQENDYLIIAKTRLPNALAINNNKDIKENNNQESKEEKCKVEIETKIRHDGEINKAKIMPQNLDDACLIATKANNGEVRIFDYFKFKSTDEIATPTIILNGQTEVGYGLSWNTIQKGLILSSSYDCSVCLWDINDNIKENENKKVCCPIKKYKEHEKECEDVCFSKSDCNLFVSCGDDKTIKIYDKRADRAMNSIIGHDAEINSIDMNPVCEFLYITGSSDKTVALWDLRKPEIKLHSFNYHKDAITNVKWNPRLGNIFASAGEDNKVLIWDLTQIGEIKQDNEEAPNEMIFEHGGHLDKINDIDWNLLENMMLASVDNANILHIWEMNVNNIFK